ncbi:MAG: acyltransferase [Gammaproteobacteria bacterium]|nr:acyltransferase [Gammaproteobacteria bacterium]
MKAWSQAIALAEKTPADRNRYVDFLRAVSITLVIVGHWLISTAYYSESGFEPGHMLGIQPWTQWLTWLFQVMPVFFFVGGYANGVSLESARRKQLGYGAWLYARLVRLLSPLLLLLLAWTILAIVLRVLGVSREVIQLASQASLIPIWFLAIYIMIVVVAPLTYRLWQRFGRFSTIAFASLAMITDMIFFLLDIRWPGWANYFWVWLAVHQLGYAWRDNRIGKPWQLLAAGVLGLATLAALILNGPYPLAMVGSPDGELSNTLPPKITLLFLGIAQFGILLAIETPVRKWLAKSKVWAATILVNSMIMTVYLWHMTIMIILVGLLFLAGGFGLGLEPGSAAWWWSRPLWLAVLFALLLPVAAALAPLERRKGPQTIPQTPLMLAGAALACLGLALLALFGVGGGPFKGADVASLTLVLVGAFLAGLIGLPEKRRQA